MKRTPGVTMPVSDSFVQTSGFNFHQRKEKAGVAPEQYSEVLLLSSVVRWEAARRSSSSCRHNCRLTYYGVFCAPLEQQLIFKATPQHEEQSNHEYQYVLEIMAKARPALFYNQGCLTARTLFLGRRSTDQRGQRTLFTNIQKSSALRRTVAVVNNFSNNLKKHTLIENPICYKIIFENCSQLFRHHQVLWVFYFHIYVIGVRECGDTVISLS